MVFTFSVVVVRGSERGKVPGPWLRLRRDTGSDGDQESSEGQMSDFTNLETKGKFLFVSVHSPSFVLCLMFDERGKIKIRKMIILGLDRIMGTSMIWEPELHINTKK